MYYCVFAASACITVNCVVVDNTRGVIIDQLRATTDVVMEKLIKFIRRKIRILFQVVT